MPTKIIIYAAKDNSKNRKRKKIGELYAAKDANRALNKQLEKALLKKDNPRQKLAEFRSQIETNARVFTAKRKRNQHKTLSIQRSKAIQQTSSAAFI
ncbi:hypothetical protein [Providencia alcalifaciens]|uniref:hypothetical protein n=1 Tax=Providencia alcalifaciens TaxID=126385 RepID=UPI002B0554FE|nr:hypothetical protein [Providencia alcalifaciens]